MSSELCLICHDSCSTNTTGESSPDPESTNYLPVTFALEPSVSSVLLENLGVYFILRHVLELPSEQLENYLRHCPNPGDWVKICQVCRRNYVEKCERIFVEFLEVKRKFNVARLELIGVVRRSNEPEIVTLSNKLGGEGSQEPVILDICKETRRFVIQNEYRDCKINPFIDGDEKAREKLEAQETRTNIKLDILEKELKEEPHSPEENDVSNSNPTTVFECDYDPDAVTDNDGNLEVEDVDWNANDYNSPTESSGSEEESDSNPPEDESNKECDAKSKKSSISVQTRNSKRTRKKSSEKRTTNTKSTIFACDLCSTEFNSEKRLRFHQIRTHKTNYYTCSECNWKTGAAYLLSQHIQSQHPEKWRKPKPMGQFKCDHCSKSFNVKRDLRQHEIHKHKVNFYECTNCDQKFVNSKVLLEHMKQYHDFEKNLDDLKCPTCNKKFTNKYILKEHISRHNNESRRKFKCDHCGKEYIEKVSLYTHLGSEHGITDNLKYKCSFEGCGEAFYNQSKLKEHEDIHKPDQYHCEICGASFKKRNCFKNHVNYHKKMEAMAFHCPHCPGKFARADNLRSHVDTVHKSTNTTSGKGVRKWQGKRMFKCSECGLWFGWTRLLDRHMEKMHPDAAKNTSNYVNIANLICNQCGVSFSSSNDLRNHDIQVHNSNLYGCSKCGFKCATEYDMRCHKRQYHKSNRSVEYSSRQNTKTKCSKCEKLLSSKQQLRLHMARCHDNGEMKMFKCDHCGKEYFGKVSLHSHLGAVHGIKDFLRVTCDFEGCGKSFYLERQLQRHKEQKHGNPEERRKFLCHLCPAKFVGNLSLKYHINSAHIGEKGLDGEDGKAKIFKCHICGKILSKKWNLKIHIETVHEGNEKNGYSVCCDVCGKVIKSKYYLELHKSRVHKIGNVQEKRFACEVEGCSKTYLTKVELETHKLFVHEGKRNYQCDICGKSLATPRNLRFHIKVMHSENRESKPWKCEECGKGFAVKGYLWLHMNTHQPKNEEKKVEQL